jgi:ribulose-5-phosphate 4-epimerase/fuculose-1-phosphate aldolase
MGTTKLCILRNHGLLTGGRSPAEAVGWFLFAERCAEIHVKATSGGAGPTPITDEAAKSVAQTLEQPGVGWRVFQWVARDLVPDPSVVL